MSQSLSAQLSDSKKLYQSVSDLLHDAPPAGQSTMENMSLSESDANTNISFPTLCFNRTIARKCRWNGCHAEFGNHPEFVAHVISCHCSDGGGSLIAEGTDED